MSNIILVANDGSANAQHATEVASAIALKNDAEIIMVYVVQERFLADALKRYAAMEPLRILDDIQTSEVQERMQAMANDAAQHDSSLRDASAHVGQHALDLGEQIARNKGVEKVQTHLEFGNPAREILQHAEFAKADLIIIGRNGHRTSEDNSLGSTANKILHGAKCSCLAVGKSAS